ncbi:MAG TPA: AAA family ATPase [Methylophilus sp.]
MYYAHFGLKEPPFKITPNTEHFFNGNNRGAVLDALIYAITHGEGIVKVVGEVGSGKTMLCRMLQTMLPPHVESIYLANPSVAPEDILHAIAFELDLKLPKAADKLKVMQLLQAYLLERHAAGKQVVIFIEEAQGMPLATLEEIRLLSNLETKHDKLLQMVLFGQPELDVNLNQSHIRQLRERITHSFTLTPLQPQEIGEYLIFRLRAAGYFGPHLFSDKAITKLAHAAKGLIRRVNILADKALLAAFADNVYQVTPKHVKAAIADSEFGVEQIKKTQQRRWLYGLLGLLVLATLLVYALQRLNDMDTSSKRVVTQPLKQAAANKLVAPKAEQPVAPTVSPPPSASPISGASATPNTQPINASAPAAISTITAAPVNTTPAPAATAVNATALATALPASVPSSNAPAPSLLDARLDITRQWLQTSSPDTVTIQMLGTADEILLKQQLAFLVQSIELDKLYVYPTKVNNQLFYAVVYGSYIDRAAAYQALKKLPEHIQKNRPQLRTVGGIVDETSKNL